MSYSEASAHKAIDDWINTAVRHGQKVSAEVRKDINMIRRSSFQIDELFVEDDQQKEESDR